MLRMGLLLCSKSYNAADGIKIETRDLWPSHYVFKIERFSILLKNEMEKYETGEFEAGKCKWRLIIYPNGDPLRNGKDHLSLFLRIVPDANSLKASGAEVNAMVKFFLYDQKSDIYYTAHGKANRFHALNLEWGISKFLPLKDFNEPSNGYLVDDVCIFGVEIFVIQDPCKCECLKLIERSPAKFPLKIFKFSTKTSMVNSEAFYIGNYAWKIWLFPKGDGKGKDQSISVFLNLSNSEILSPGQKVHVEFSISIKELVDITNKFKASHLFSAASNNWGFPMFMPLNTIKENIVNDSFILEAEVSVLGEVNEFH